jgi:hypothetical protein
MKATKYAVYFPELSDRCTDQTGYLWVKKLGAGDEGVVDLVVSVADRQLYARKRRYATEPANSKYHCAEVYHHRWHPRIPKLISDAELQVLEDTQKQVEQVKAIVTLSKYCNGGTLDQFHHEYQEDFRPRRELTESFVWELWAHQLEMLTYFHTRCDTPLGNLDAHSSNIFLHFADETSKFPEFFAGDLGQLEEIKANIWAPAQAGRPRRLKDASQLEKTRGSQKALTQLLTDLICVSNVTCDAVVLFDQEERSGLQTSDKSSCSETGAVRSKALTDCQRELEDIIDDMKDFSAVQDGTYRDSFMAKRDTDPEKVSCDSYNNLQELQASVGRHTAQARAKDSSDVDLSWCRDVPDRPTLWLDRDMLLSDCNAQSMRGPFRVAKVDPSTLDVLKIEKTEYGRQYPYLIRAGRFSDDDRLSDPLQNHSIPTTHDNTRMYHYWQEDAELAALCDDLDQSDIDAMLSRIPTMEWDCGVMDYGVASGPTRYVPARKLEKGAITIKLGREHFRIKKWRDGLGQHVRRWRRCLKHQRLCRTRDEDCE